MLGTDGAVFAGGLISTPTLPLVAVSRAQGYVEAAAVGTVPLTALDVVRADIAAGQTTIATAGATAAVDLTLVLQTPAVVSLTPSDSSTNVPLVRRRGSLFAADGHNCVDGRSRCAPGWTGQHSNCRLARVVC